QDIITANPGIQFIQFRFVFRSSPFNVILDGISIDDICVTQPGPNDAGTIQIVQPSAAAPAGDCDLVIVTIYNYGSAPITSTNISYSIDTIGCTTCPIIFGPYPWTGTLAPGASTTDTLPCFTVPAGSFDLCTWTDLTNDLDATNDTTCTTLVGIATFTIDSATQYCDDFEGSSYWYNILNAGGAPTTNWELGTPAYNATSGAHSGVNAWDINLNTAYDDNSSTSLYTPIFKVSNTVNPYLSFWINYNTEFGYDAVRLQYDTNNTGNWTNLIPNDTMNWYPQGQAACSGARGWRGNSGGWQHVTANDLSTMNLGGTTQYVQFRFNFCSDAIINIDGFSLDDFCFAMPAPYDAGVPQITSPDFSAAAGICQDVIVNIKNFGSNTLTSFNVYYAIDTIGCTTCPIQFGPFPWTGTLAPGATTSFTMPCFNVPAGQYTICSWTSLTADGNAFNDTTCTQSTGVPILPLSYTSSYCDDFNGPNIGWTVETTGQSGTDWQLGQPTVGQTNNAFSPPNCWDVNLTTTYGSNAFTYLYTPIFDWAGANGLNPVLSFYLNFNTGQNQDGVHVEFKKDNNNWTTLFSTGNTDNWYNATTTCSPGWSGTSFAAVFNPPANINGWIQVIDSDLAILNGATTVQFRFAFCSVNFPFGDGFSIDNFCVTVPVPLTVSPTTCNNTSNPPFIFPGQTITFNTDIKNQGFTPITSAVACLYIDGVLQGGACDTINYSPALAFHQSANHVFSSSYVTTPGVHTTCMVTTFPNQGNDLNPTDDTICCSISVIDTVGVGSAPYCPDFDSSPQWVTYNSYPPYAATSSWVLGTPNISFMTGANTGVKAWKTGSLTGTYPNNDSSSLFTPAFNILAGRTYRLSFSQQQSTETYQDGGVVEFSIDNGASWQVYGSPCSGPSCTWFTSFFVTALGGSPPLPGWSGVIPTWQQRHNDYCFPIYNGLTSYAVMFRFRFASDYSVSDLGWLIDDFCFEDLNITCPTGMEDISNSSGMQLGQNHPNPANGLTNIDYMIPERGTVSLTVTNLMGQVVETLVDEDQAQGIHSISFDANKLNSGVYFYSLTFNNESLVKKMVITK
ncbi:MAG: T9SS type A sorting domain-containing protein, partial [Bacteroidia bacterium]